MAPNFLKATPDSAVRFSSHRLLTEGSGFGCRLDIPTKCAQWRSPKDVRTTFGPTSVQFERWLHRVSPRKRHQMRHLCDLACLLAKQVLFPVNDAVVRN